MRAPSCSLNTPGVSRDISPALLGAGVHCVLCVYRVLTQACFPLTLVAIEDSSDCANAKYKVEESAYALDSSPLGTGVCLGRLC